MWGNGFICTFYTWKESLMKTRKAFFREIGKKVVRIAGLPLPTERMVHCLLFKTSAVCLQFSLHTCVNFYLLIFRSPLFQERHFQNYTSYTPSTSLTTTSVKLTTVSLPICWASGIWILLITIWNSWDQQPLERFQPSCKLI